MKTWIKRLWIGIFGASLALGGVFACSRHHEHGWSLSDEDALKYRTKIVERVGSKLDLTEPQKERLGVLTDSLRAQAKALVGATSDPRAEFRALFAGPQFDKVRAQAIIEEKTGALRNKSPDVIAAAANFFDSLDAAQQQKVRDFMQHRHGWFGRS